MNNSIRYFLAIAISLPLVATPVAYAQNRSSHGQTDRAAHADGFDKTRKVGITTAELDNYLASTKGVSPARADSRRNAFLQFLHSEFKQYELSVMHGGKGGAPRDQRSQIDPRFEDFMRYVSDPKRITQTFRARYLADPRNQWEIKRALSEFVALVGKSIHAEEMLEEVAIHAAYHLLVRGAEQALSVSLGIGGYVVGGVLGMENDLGHTPRSRADDSDVGEERRSVISSRPSILDSHAQDGSFNSRGRSQRGPSNNGESNYQGDASGDSGGSSSNSPYQQSRNQRDYEPRGTGGGGASNGNGDQPRERPRSENPPREGDSSDDNDVPTESMREYPSMDAYESGHPGRELPERLIDDPSNGHNRRNSPRKGGDLGVRALPRGAPDRRSGLNRMDVRKEDPARSPLPVSQGPDDSEKPRFPGSHSNRGRATRGDNDLGNDLPFQSRNRGGPSVASFAESLWWQRNGPRAQPTK